MLHTGGVTGARHCRSSRDTDTKQCLDQLAKTTERTRSYLAAEAIRQYLELNAWQIREIQQAERDFSGTRTMKRKACFLCDRQQTSP